METSPDHLPESHPEAAVAEPGVAAVFSLRDPQFNPAAVGSSNLAIELGGQYLRLAVVEARQAQRQVVEEFSLGGTNPDEPLLHDVRHLMSNHDVLTRNFWASVRVTVNNQSFTLVPEPLFRKEYAVRYLELARGTSLVAEKVHHTHHPGWNTVVVFSLPARLDDYLQSVYPFEGLRFFHQMDILLAVALEGKPSGGKHLLLMLEKASVSLLYLEEGRLVYANRFAYRTLNDLIYYVLFALNELSLAPADLDVHAWGQLEPDDATHRGLAEYLPNVHVGDLRSSVPLSGPFADLPTHRYVGLLKAASLA